MPAQLDVLEYMHDNEYVHADIKAANVLLDHKYPSKVSREDCLQNGPANKNGVDTMCLVVLL